MINALGTAKLLSSDSRLIKIFSNYNPHPISRCIVEAIISLLFSQQCQGDTLTGKLSTPEKIDEHLRTNANTITQKYRKNCECCPGHSSVSVSVSVTRNGEKMIRPGAYRFRPGPLTPLGGCTGNGEKTIRPGAYRF